MKLFWLIFFSALAFTRPIWAGATFIPADKFDAFFAQPSSTYREEAAKKEAAKIPDEAAKITGYEKQFDKDIKAFLKSLDVKDLKKNGYDLSSIVVTCSLNDPKKERPKAKLVLLAIFHAVGKSDEQRTRTSFEGNVRYLQSAGSLR